MPDSLEIHPVSGPVRGTIRPPGSKSITNRALVCAALADGGSTLRGALDSEDTRVMIAALGELGIPVTVEESGRTLRVTGCGGAIPAARAELFVANSGTTMRFLTAAAALGRGEYRLDGIARMRARPMGDQAAAMRNLGVDVVCEGPGECPPIVVRGGPLRGGRTHIRGDASSQFLSGLLMAAPYAARDVELIVEGALVSVPYVAMTQRVMESFGADVSAIRDYAELRVSSNQRYLGRDYEIEPDASAASYFFAAAAITGGRVTVEGLGRESLQGDVAFVSCLENMGARISYETGNSMTVEGGPLVGVDVDMNAISDTAPTMAVTALFAQGPTRIRNIAHVRHKETDRIAAVATELRKLGATVDEFPDGMRITPPEGPRGAAIDTYNDHRMAMSFALAGLVTPGIVINDPACTSKTYPDFFADLDQLVRPRKDAPA
jgi:3-phosphoshikimate 1-carboxyvinyltransferase